MFAPVCRFYDPMVSRLAGIAAMDIFETIERKLEKYPGARVARGTNSITVEAADANAFEVSLWQGGGEYVVHFEGWHEHFAEPEAALECFAFGLSDGCRLKVQSRCSIDHEWTVEYMENGDWREDSTTGLLLFPFWCRWKVRYLRNRLIENGPAGASFRWPDRRGTYI